MSGSSVGTYIRDGSCITMDSSEVSRVSVSFPHRVIPSGWEPSPTARLLRVQSFRW